MTSEPLTDHEARELAARTQEYADNVLKGTVTISAPDMGDLLFRDIVAVCLWQQQLIDYALSAIRDLQAAARDREGDGK